MIEKKPLITIVMPCLNEEAYIARAVRSLLDSWTIRNCELLVVDGGSTDGTKKVVEDLVRNPPETLESWTPGGSTGGGGTGGASAQGRPEDEVIWLMQSRDSWVREVSAEWNPVTSGKRRAVIRLLDNPGRTTATGMNMGIAQAAGKIIARADAHCVFPPAYVRRCVELLADMGAANAGGVMVPRGEGGATQAAIALAMRHPLGTGDAAFRRTDFKGEAEGVIFGTFRKALFDEIGGYDVKAPANEDSELNVRILCSGKKIYLDSDIKITYFPRKTLRELGKQYFRYGRGRARTTLRHKMLTGWRQAAAPVLLLATAYAVVRAVLGQPVHLLVPAAYALGIVGAALFTLKPMGDEGVGAAAGAGAGESGLSFKTRMTVAAAWAVMHLCWGAGFLSGLVKWW
jgi:succinoglycan biosynthesis protein ExoA